ncbi:MAG TPA: cytoplasmic protein [Deltaproteobacteria bacterium]|nr:cytoplasmic protein [Deltaproteobacteria bacterium]
MNRREFIKLLGSSVLVGGLFPHHLLATGQSVLSVAEGTDYEAITKTALEALGGIGRFVKAGNVVVIKPNIGWDRRPEQAANTHPGVIRALAQECIKAGARRVKVFDNPCNEPRRSYANSGIAGALRGLKDVDLKHIETERFKKITLNGVFLKEWEIYSEALSADVLINVPVAKHHGLSRLTLGLKNMMGIMGGNRGYIHARIDEALADLNTKVRSHLVVVDATRILTAHGPQGGSIADVKVLNKVIASTDIVAADSYATTLFGMEPKDIPTTVAAYRRRLGEMDLRKVKILKT